MKLNPENLPFVQMWLYLTTQCTGTWSIFKLSLRASWALGGLYEGVVEGLYITNVAYIQIPKRIRSIIWPSRRDQRLKTNTWGKINPPSVPNNLSDQLLSLHDYNVFFTRTINFTHINEIYARKEYFRNFYKLNH